MGLSALCILELDFVFDLLSSNTKQIWQQFNVSPSIIDVLPSKFVYIKFRRINLKLHKDLDGLSTIFLNLFAHTVNVFIISEIGHLEFSSYLTDISPSEPFIGLCFTHCIFTKSLF